MAKRNPKREDQPKPSETTLTDEELEQVAGGATAEPATTTTGSTILKTKHDTAKNSISNVR